MNIGRKFVAGGDESNTYPVTVASPTALPYNVCITATIIWREKMNRLLLSIPLIILLAACAPVQTSAVTRTPPPIIPSTTETHSPEPSHTPTIAVTKTEIYQAEPPTSTFIPAVPIPNSIYDILPPGQYLLFTDWSQDIEIESTHAISPLTKEVYLVASMYYATTSTNGRFLIISAGKYSSYLFDCWENRLELIRNTFSYTGLSPDGKLSASGAQRLTLNYLEDGENIELSTGMKYNDTIHYAVWSPDGKWIGYVQDNPEYRTTGDLNEYNSLPGIYITRSDCIDEPQDCGSLTYGPFFPTDSIAHDSSLTWSPDSRYLAYAQEGEEIYMYDLTTGEEGVIKTSEPFAVIFWSPDGKWIAFNNYNGIFLISPTTKETIQLTDYPGWLTGWLVVPEPTAKP